MSEEERPPLLEHRALLEHLTWLVGDWGLHGKLQGVGGRPQHWDHHMEALEQQLESALYLRPACPHLGWSHRAPLVYLRRQKAQVG